jgi:hypothetical protein
MADVTPAVGVAPGDLVPPLPYPSRLIEDRAAYAIDATITRLTKQRFECVRGRRSLSWPRRSVDHLRGYFGGQNAASAR